MLTFKRQSYNYLLFVFIITLLLLVFLSLKVFALSPSFIRQEVFDGFNDTLYFNNTYYSSGGIFRAIGDNFTDKDSIDMADSIDIAGVSYFSNGRILNVTLALATPIGDNEDKTYRMLIDVDSNNKTGNKFLGGADYIIQTWGPNCSANLHEWTLAKGKYEQFFPEKGGYFTEIGTPQFVDCALNHVRFSLDLSKIAYPKEYNIAFLSKLEKGRYIHYSDFTKWIHIPPPSLPISILQDNLELRQGESKNIPISINSTTDLESIIQLSHNYKGPYSNVNFLDDTFVIPPFGSEVGSIHVNISKNSPIGFYIIIPIIADISFPYKSVISPDENLSHTNKKVPFLNTSSHTNLLIKVKGPLTTPEFLSDINNKWITPIAGIWTFLIGVITVSIPFLITIYKMYKKKKLKKTEYY